MVFLIQTELRLRVKPAMFFEMRRRAIAVLTRWVADWAALGQFGKCPRAGGVPFQGFAGAVGPLSRCRFRVRLEKQ